MRSLLDQTPPPFHRPGLTQRDLVALLRDLSWSLKRRKPADDAVARWFLAGLETWKRDGGTLDNALGLTARRGSHWTAQYQLEQLIADERQAEEIAAQSDETTLGAHDE